MKGGPFGLARYNMLRGKTGKTFWFTSLGQIVQFGAIIFCRTFKNYFGQFVWIEKSHYNSRFMKRRIKIEMQTNASFQINVSFVEFSIKERHSSGLFNIQFCAEFSVRKTQSGEMSYQTDRSATVAHKSNSKIAQSFIKSSLPPNDRTHV